jgi:hypothetical protein
MTLFTAINRQVKVSLNKGGYSLFRAQQNTKISTNTAAQSQKNLKQNRSHQPQNMHNHTLILDIETH